MKKTIGVIGLSLHIISYALFIIAIITAGDYSISLWYFSVLVAGLAIVFYLIDAIKASSISSKAIIKIKLILADLALPVLIFCGTSIYFVPFIIWNVLFAVLFIIEIITLFIKLEKPEKE